MRYTPSCNLVVFAVLGVYVQPFFIIVWFLVSHNLLFISEYCFVLKVCGHHHWALWAAAWSPRWGRWSGASWRRWWPPAAACSSWGWGRPAPRWPTCWCPAGVKYKKLFIVYILSLIFCTWTQCTNTTPPVLMMFSIQSAASWKWSARGKLLRSTAWTRAVNKSSPSFQFPERPV